MPRSRFFNLIAQIVYVAKRKAYALRLLIPGLRRLHKLEVIVGPRGFWQECRAYQLEVLKRNGLQPTDYLLDFGCGPMQGGVAFITYLESGRYVGVDNREYNMSTAYSEIIYHGLVKKNPRLIFANDFGKAELNGTKFDMIWASQILYYFDNAQLSELIQYAYGTLRSKGRFLFDILGESPPEYATPNHMKWMNSMNLHSINTIRSLAEPIGFSVRSLGEVQDYGYPRALNLHTNIVVELAKH